MAGLLSVLPWLLVLGALVGGLWWLGRRPPEARLTREVAPVAFAGSEGPLRVRLTLRSRRPLRYVVSDPAPRRLVPSAQVVFSGEVYGEAERCGEYRLRVQGRGDYTWPGPTLHWADPLGLFWRSCPLSAETHLTALPGTHGLRLPELLRPLLSEGSLARTVGLDDPLSLRGARAYVTGDPPGRVHWRLSARTGELTVRELERTAASSLTVYIDTGYIGTGGSRAGASDPGEDVYLESAVRLAASLVGEALHLGLPVSVAWGDEQTPSGRSEAAAQAALIALARLRHWAGPVKVPAPPPGGNLILLTQRAAPELIAGAMRARAQASRVSIVALPEGFYLEPGESPRRQWAAPPDSVRELERQAGALAGVGVLVYVLRGNHSVLRLGSYGFEK